MGRAAARGVLIRVDSRGSETLQHQIYAGIRRAILDGGLDPGERLPSSRALASDLGVSRTTSLLAIEQLLAEGYLTARHGSGTYVARDLPDDAPDDPGSLPTPEPHHPPLSRRGVALAAMPPPARRIMGTPPRPFRIGTPAVDLFPTRLWGQVVRRRVRALTRAQLDYSDSAGLRTLREVIAGHLRTRGTHCEADQVVVVAGAQRGLELIARLLLDPGDKVWLEEPGYPGARSALVTAGANIVPVPVDTDGLDVEAGARRAPDARLAYVTPSHQFPLAVTLSLPRRLALLDWARAARAWVVEDDYDSEFRYGTPPIPCLHGLAMDGRVIYVGSFSKTLFPGLRLGFLVVSPSLCEGILAARRASEANPPVLDQAALADFIGDGHFDRHLRRMQVIYRERLEALTVAAERHCAGALRLRPTHAGLHLVADLVDGDATSVFREAATRGVEVTPLIQYFMSGPPADHALVLGFGAVGSDGVERGMQLLAAAIEAAR